MEPPGPIAIFEHNDYMSDAAPMAAAAADVIEHR